MSSQFPSATTILESIAGYSQQIAKASNPSANAPIRLAVVDPSYVANTYPATLPKVTFEGEETLSEKRYPVLYGYWPVANDRVVMLPVGHAYVILGGLNTGGPFVRFDNGGDTGKVIQMNSVNLSIPNGGNDDTTGVSFSPAFKGGTTPKVIVGVSSPGSIKTIAQAQSITNSGFTARARTVENTTGVVPVVLDWVAIGEEA